MADEYHPLAEPVLAAARALVAQAVVTGWRIDANAEASFICSVFREIGCPSADIAEQIIVEAIKAGARLA